LSEPLIGRSLSIFHNKAQLENEVIPFNEKVKKYGTCTGEVGHITKEGKTFPTLMTTTLLRDTHDNPIAFSSIARDITESKQAVEELKRSAYLLNETQRITKLGGWEYDVATNQTFFSDEVFNIYGFDGQKMLAPGEGVKFYHPDDRPLVMDSFTKAITNAEPYDLEVRFINARGENMWVRTAGKPILKNGKVVTIIGNVMDITDRKKVEEELQKHREHLEELVIERTREIEDKNIKLERINKAFVGRELRMKELKEEIEKLKGK